MFPRYLEWSVTDGSEVRRQDAASVLASVARSSVGYYVAKDFIYDRIDDIYNAWVVFEANNIFDFRDFYTF